jgi:hypothetical protein
MKKRRQRSSSGPSTVPAMAPCCLVPPELQVGRLHWYGLNLQPMGPTIRTTRTVARIERFVVPGAWCLGLWPRTASSSGFPSTSYTNSFVGTPQLSTQAHGTTRFLQAHPHLTCIRCFSCSLHFSLRLRRLHRCPRHMLAIDSAANQSRPIVNSESRARADRTHALPGSLDALGWGNAGGAGCWRAEGVIHSSDSLNFPHRPGRRETTRKEPPQRPRTPSTTRIGARHVGTQAATACSTRPACCSPVALGSEPRITGLASAFLFFNFFCSWVEQ